MKRTALGAPEGGVARETWEVRRRDGETSAFPVDIRLGKPFDVLRLKGETPRSSRRYATYFATIAGKLYGPSSPRVTIAACPCCGTDASGARVALSVYGASYRTCGRCGHGFVGEQPTQETLRDVFTEDEVYATVYTDREAVELRHREIIVPKIDWMLDAYRRHRGRLPGSVLDVGAGGGHFVSGCRRAGIRAEGYELNRSALRFAREALGVELANADFIQHRLPRGAFEVVTFWGLLEYTPDPATFVSAARRLLDPGNGFLVVEVPRLDCFGTAVQREFPDTISRHAIPTSHMNLFTELSLATLLAEHGFRPVAAWYFGMDVYELFVQLSVELDDERVLSRLGRIVAPLQAFLDAARVSDDLIVAALPV